MRRLRDFPIEFSNSRHRHCERSEAIHLSPQRKKRMDCFAALAMTCNPDAVIPGWSTGPDLRCAIAHRGISRFRVRCGACHRAALRADPLASPRNDGVCSNSKHDFAISRRDAPEVCMNLPPPLRAWGMPGARCTRGLVCNCSDRTHTSNNEYTGIARHPRTQWFYGLCRALPGDRAFLPPSPRGYVLSKPGWADATPQDLTPASGRQDHTILPYAKASLVSVLVIAHRFLKPALRSHRALNAAASTATHPAFRDGHDTPLLWGGMGRICRDDLPDG